MGEGVNRQAWQLVAGKRQLDDGRMEVQWAMRNIPVQPVDVLDLQIEFFQLYRIPIAHLPASRV